MKYKVECTHIVSQLLNIKKYENYPLHASNGQVYIEVDEIAEYLAIYGMELNMSAALSFYRDLIKETSK